MKFDEKTHKVEISSMAEDEAVAYICFLGDERIRHDEELRYTKERIKYYRWWAGRKNDLIKNKAFIQFWQSANQRHKEDIQQIDALVEMARHWFELKEE